MHCFEDSGGVNTLPGLSNALSRLTQLVLRSLFLYGFIEAREGSTLLQLLFTIVALIVVIKSYVFAVCILLAVLIVYIVHGIGKYLKYSLALATLPALWMALSNALIAYLRGGDVVRAIVSVFFRAESGSAIVLLFLHTLNISEARFILYKLSSMASFATTLFWRLASQFIKEASEILYIHGLKGEKTWKTLAMLFIRGEEMIQYFTEGIYLKQYNYRPKVMYSSRAVAIQILLLSIATLLLFL
jgi:hypothetical protein